MSTLNKENVEYLRFITLSFVIASALLAAYHIYVQYSEARAIHSYLDSNGLWTETLNHKHILQIIDRVRADFNSDEETFEQLNMSARPFLREDTQTLLRYREGLCGEGTRVIISLLIRLGYDATRLTLYDKRLQSAHTLVSVRLNGNEFLVDSINSEAWVHAFLETELIAPSDFDVLHYTDNHGARRKFELSATEINNRGEAFSRFLTTYTLYSYEAIPYTKLLTSMGWDIRVFNFQRPGRLISRLAEAPNLIYMLFWAGISAVFFVITLFAKINSRA